MEECESWASNVVRDVFGDGVPAARSVERTQWSRDLLSRGSYTYVAVGSTPEDIAALGQPVDDRLFFAGEATYRYHWAGAHGALASGIVRRRASSMIPPCSCRARSRRTGAGATR